MINTHPIQTLILPNVQIGTRQAFLKFIKQHIHTFALKRQAEFVDAHCNAEYFHKNKQGTEKVPLFIHSFLYEQQFALRAYTQAGVDTLSFWYRLFSKAYPELCEQVILKNETCTIDTAHTTQIYESDNWIPYRKCVLKDGFYYNTFKNEVANFHNTLLGNLRTFLSLLGFDNTLRFTLDLKTLQEDQPIVALLDQRKDITKNAFKVTIATNLELPLLFSLGQNVGYGNGVFVKK